MYALHNGNCTLQTPKWGWIDFSCMWSAFHYKRSILDMTENNTSPANIGTVNLLDEMFLCFYGYMGYTIWAWGFIWAQNVYIILLSIYKPLCGAVKEIYELQHPITFVDVYSYLCPSLYLTFVCKSDPGTLHVYAVCNAKNTIVIKWIAAAYSS